MAARTSARGAGLPKNRIEALADGIFAIAMTLLVLDIKVPVIDYAVHEELPMRLLALWPRFLSFGISFVMLGIYWVGHHNQFHSIRRTDRALLWINILFMMCISLIPFSAALLSEYPHERIVLVFYAVNLIIVGSVLTWHWRYATSGHRLVDSDLNAVTISLATRRILMGPAFNMIAIVLAFISVEASLIVLVLTPFIYVLPGRIDRHWRT